MRHKTRAKTRQRGSKALAGRQGQGKTGRQAGRQAIKSPARNRMRSWTRNFTWRECMSVNILVYFLLSQRRGCLRGRRGWHQLREAGQLGKVEESTISNWAAIVRLWYRLWFKFRCRGPKCWVVSNVGENMPKKREMKSGKFSIAGFMVVALTHTHTQPCTARPKLAQISINCATGRMSNQQGMLFKGRWVFPFQKMPRRKL